MIMEKIGWVGDFFGIFYNSTIHATSYFFKFLKNKMAAFTSCHLFARLFARLFSCLFVCFLFCLFARLLVYLFIYLFFISR